MRNADFGLRNVKCEFLIVDRGERVGAGSKPTLNKMRDERQKTTGKGSRVGCRGGIEPPSSTVTGRFATPTPNPQSAIRNPKSGIWKIRNMKIEYQPIGIIHTPYTDLVGMPIQPAGAAGVEGTVEVFAEYRDGLQDLEGFSHIILLYHLHGSKGFKLHVMPFLDTESRGLFATRAPKRPNPIGLSVVKLRKVEGGVLSVENVDMLDGTPLLDIKPYIPAFDAQRQVRTGWFAKAIGMVAHKKSDDRFR